MTPFKNTGHYEEKERNAEIIKIYEQVPRISIANIARQFNMTRQRAHYIVKQHYKKQALTK